MVFVWFCRFQYIKWQLIQLFIQYNIVSDEQQRQKHGENRGHWEPFNLFCSFYCYSVSVCVCFCFFKYTYTVALRLQKCTHKNYKRVLWSLLLLFFSWTPSNTRKKNNVKTHTVECIWKEKCRYNQF